MVLPGGGDLNHVAENISLVRSDIDAARIAPKDLSHDLHRLPVVRSIRIEDGSSAISRRAVDPAAQESVK